ncbi:DUF6051 family protein [Myroides pelagicus]|uniref:Alpha/beta hydrolase n=1 Tax=Myroides pelagicus TaxID=270914 RepID=A0A7K1GPB4_9FLAO|nr:DUF6051 family protein [Myroides pelagicus]MTH30054.1 hypothetical protein [Myroides pelagicus]
MHYYQIHERLKQLFQQDSDVVKDDVLGVEIHKYPFFSKQADGILIGSERLFCSAHQEELEESFVKYTEDTDTLLDVPDYSVKENLNYTIAVVKPMDKPVCDEVIVMYHGLNEKKWDKYLPWAYALTKRTGKAVVLFPISFHMDRTPWQWSDRKLMFEIAQKRAADWKQNSDSSYVNAAISTRMEAHPQRMFWSGLQTYYDFIDWERALRAGAFDVLSPRATIDLFGYSIGSFLSIILMMANPLGILSQAKLVCFCGGMTIDRMFPVSKYIMDGRATIMMQKIFAQLLTTNFAAESRLNHYQDRVLHPGESWFKTMLRYNHFQGERESRLRELEKQILSINLKTDEVAPPVEALNMLKGPYRDIAIDVNIFDFPFKYSHMVPFPLTSKNAEEVDVQFNLIMDKMAQFYQKK